jgi:chromo domain-containing protein 1
MEMKGFGQVLRKEVTLWSVGMQPELGYDEATNRGEPIMAYDSIAIFPQGGFISLTDEVFEEKPQVALQIVKLFFAKVEKVKALDGPTNPMHQVVAPLLWRLRVRPELMVYLYDHCIARGDLLEARDPDVQAYVPLSPLSYLPN